MFRWQTLSCVVIAAVLAGAQAGKYHLGRAATTKEIENRNISIFPTGAGLPPGNGSAQQGKRIYTNQCASCHGMRGEGTGPNPALAGGIGTLKSDKPVITVGSYWPYATTVWDYINRAMPPQNAGSLTPDEVYSTTAYVLYLNGLIKDDELINAKTLPKIKMPNRNGFVPDPRPDTKPKQAKTK